ncbi:MAG: HlyD family efflux transporter periplasmic adaptor subunit [Desulfarculaceae bacterium]|nr:HlyD family efflux transporter periplasmic adaptor subunit [Desulfarculaceae bacterium]MCF8072638.1 HlyD family efflux transporter periplasmic adaptor subunit [Desulfarculaceae bacterium]MCF8102517.1 HlyD family efflux transporter periplasmic adaptor subunit [Desulfarculaceae bacterium]MCF8117980.1 HlyD family efflux transporter periplasmic adaptor subunit [Desulfarculaceae bacterium]
MAPVRALLMTLALLCLGAAPCLAGQAAPAPAAAPQGQVVTARPATRLLTFSGFTRARAKLPLASEVAGRCQKVFYDVGETIGKHGVFATLDDTFVRLDLEKNQVEQKRLASRVAYLKKDTERYRKLVQRGSEAPSRLDRQEDELTQASLQLASLQTQARVLRERQQRHQIKGPPGWRVIERSVEPGQWVAAGATVGLAGDFRTLLVPLALSPEEFAQLHRLEGDITVHLPHLDLEVPAKVERLNPGFDPVTRKIVVDLELGPGLDERRGGLRVELALKVPDPSGAVVLPAGAVAERYQEHWVTREDGSQVRVIFLGPGPKGTVRVSSPKIEPGQRFVVKQ